MTDRQISDTNAIFTVAVPEICALLENPQYLNGKLSEAFSFASQRKYKNILLMKKLLSDLFDGNITAPDTPDKYASIMEKIYASLDKYTPEDLSWVFPGLIHSTIPLNNSSVRRLTAIGNSATVSSEENKLLHMITESPVINWSELTIRCKRSDIKSAVCLVPSLTERGVTVSLCCYMAENLAFHNGIPVVPGKSLLRVLPEFDVSDFAEDPYSSVKNSVAEILTTETEGRFRLSASRKLYHRYNSGSDKLIPLGIFYPGSVQNKEKSHMPSIIGGGADLETVIITPAFSGVMCGEEHFQYALRCVTTACSSLEKRFPFTPKTYYKNFCIVADRASMIDAIRSHIESFSGLAGYFPLEIIFAEKFMPDDATLSSVITAFFVHGGSVITFKRKGNVK